MDMETTNTETLYNKNCLVVVKPYEAEEQKILAVYEIEQNMRTQRNLAGSYTTHNKRVAQLKEYLSENFDSIGEENATEIASIFDIELETSLDVTMNVTFNFSVNVPINKVNEFTTDDFNFSVESYDYEIDNEDYSITHSDWNAY